MGAPAHSPGPAPLSLGRRAGSSSSPSSSLSPYPKGQPGPTVRDWQRLYLHSSSLRLYVWHSFLVYVLCSQKKKKSRHQHSLHPLFYPLRAQQCSAGLVKEEPQRDSDVKYSLLQRQQRKTALTSLCNLCCYSSCSETGIVLCGCVYCPIKRGSVILILLSTHCCCSFCEIKVRLFCSA